MFEEPYSGLVKLDEDHMKSKEGKEAWRKFISMYVDCIYKCNSQRLRYQAMRTKSKTSTSDHSFEQTLRMNMVRIIQSSVRYRLDHHVLEPHDRKSPVCNSMQ